MMKKGFVKILALVSALLYSIIVPAQDLPLLPSDAAVTVADLPDGIKCYVASNPSHKGLADFAIVQKVDTEEGALSPAESLLDALPRLAGQSPRWYLTRHGSRPGRKGFVDVREDAVVYHFRDISVKDQASVDSTLLFLMDIVDNSSYAPADQAIIVSGDVNAASVHQSLRSMSFMIPYGKPAQHKEYVWQGSKSAELKQTVDPKTGLVTGSIEWAASRTPQKVMNTVQTALYEKTVFELGYVLENRIASRLRQADVPAADIAFSHRNSLAGPSDELFRLAVTVAQEHTEKAFGIMSEVMNEIDSAGASAEELRLAENAYFAKLSETADSAFRSNAEYVERCIAAYLYNGSLASPVERLAFHRSKEISDEVRRNIFSGISSALLITDADASAGVPFFNAADTLALPGIGPKIKLQSSKKDHISGGYTWEFSNGFKVVYKPMDTGGRLHYALCMNGGFGSILDLEKGEGAFISDYFDICNIAGVKGSTFRQILSLSGISMDAVVNLSNVFVSGEAHKEDAELLIRSLLAVANSRRSPEQSVLDYYRRSQEAMVRYEKGTPAYIKTEIDSLMCPGYAYSTFKSSGKLTDKTMHKAEKLIDELTAKMNDGVLVIVGDISETTLKKLLLQYVGAFKTRNGSFRRVTVQYQPVSGRAATRREGSSDALLVAMSSDIALTSSNVYAAKIATMAIRQHLVSAFTDDHINVEASEALRIYPEERCSIMLSLNGKEIGNETLWKLRREISKLAETGPSAAFVAQAKEYLKNRYALDMKTPEYWLYAVALRHLDGKDFSSGYASKIDAVTPEMVKLVIAKLEKGSQVEYMIVEKK